MLKNLAIVALLAANVGLIVYLVRLPAPDVAVQTGPTRHPESASRPVPVVSVTPRQEIPDTASDAQLIEALGEAGVAEPLMRQLIYAKALLDNAAERAPGNDAFWQRDEGRGAATLARLERQGLIRDQLVDAFGEAIRDDPRFVDLFRPLNDSLPFLSSDKQVAIHEIRVRQQADRSMRFAGGMLREGREAVRESREMMDQAIQALLSAAEYEEYELRESLLSRRMRRSADLFDYTEQEFREIYRILDESPGVTSGSGWRRNEDADARIAAYLGEDRFAEYMRSQDPAYRSIRLVGAEGGHSDAEVNAVYAIQKSAIDEMRTLGRDRSLDRTRRQERMVEIRETAESDIAGVIGEASADSVMQNTKGRRSIRR